MILQSIFRRGLLLAAAVLTINTAQADGDYIDAFPGAEGAGRYTTGGRGGKVIHVTNLNDSGTGSLRAALNTSGARIIVFDVSGVIELESRLNIKYGDVTIAGQTAPGDGICLKNYDVYVGADNVIIRFLRFRMGDDRPDSNGKIDRDAIWGRYQSNVIIDHCSMSWCTDECASFYNNSNFTLQWCIIAESLRGSLHPKGYHGYGAIWGGQSASYHHNLMAHHDSRNPRFCGVRFYTVASAINTEICDMRNNVFYNWGSTNSGYAAEGGYYNFVNNYYQYGAATKTSIRYRIFEADCYGGTDDYPCDDASEVYGKFYVNGNFMYGQGENWDWDGITNDTGKDLEDIQLSEEQTIYYVETTGESEARVTASNIVEATTTTETAAEAFESVLGYAGASLVRDAIDARIVRETRNREYTYVGSVCGGYGIIDTPDDVGGYPVYNSEEAPTDTDQDGMPDDWETENGLDPSTDDSADYDLDSDYTNIEVYLNSLVDAIVNKTATVSEDETFERYDTDSSSSTTTTVSRQWDFTTWSSATLANLAADTENWDLYNSTANRYYNLTAMSGTLTANSVTISETDGLEFGSIAASKLRINANASPSSLQFNGSKLSFTVPDCEVGDVVAVTFTTASNGTARGFTITDADGVATTSDTNDDTSSATTTTYSITSAGDLTFASTGGLNISTITVTSTANTAIPTVTATQAEISAIQYYSLDGKQLSSPSRGVNIVVTTYTDGSRTTEKLLTK